MVLFKDEDDLRCDEVYKKILSLALERFPEKFGELSTVAFNVIEVHNDVIKYPFRLIIRITLGYDHCKKSASEHKNAQCVLEIIMRGGLLANASNESNEYNVFCGEK